MCAGMFVCACYWPVCPSPNPLFTKEAAGPPASPMQAMWLRPLATASTRTPAHMRVMNTAFVSDFRVKTFDSVTTNSTGWLTIKRGSVRPIHRTRTPHPVRPHHVALHGVNSRRLALSCHVQEPLNPAPSVVRAASPCPQPSVFAAGSSVDVGADD